MNLDKYKWKLRLLYITTPSYKNEKYIETKKIYEKNIKDFHKRYIRLITKRNKELKFMIHLIGFDGTIKKKYNKLEPKKVLALVDSMPMAKANITPINLSLYSDYNKDTTIPKLGFKNKEKAIYTIEKIKNKPKKYIISLLNTLIGRAMNHPHRTKEMMEAVKIFKTFLKKMIG